MFLITFITVIISLNIHLTFGDLSIQVLRIEDSNEQTIPKSQWQKRIGHKEIKFTLQRNAKIADLKMKLKEQFNLDVDVLDTEINGASGGAYEFVPISDDGRNLQSYYANGSRICPIIRLKPSETEQEVAEPSPPTKTGKRRMISRYRNTLMN